ncbi:TetR family transcriptional regulator [Kineococcus gynurae]|uniref:TetR/AcrR family transcriptional regulator n=1 Tax=Kineococcus gynurae TaxID=452979 RepID=UPI0035E65C89
MEPPTRGAETRGRILEAAMALFEENGYEKTTMRAVATRAGVSLGNAYYWFGSKQDLVQGYYERIQAEHLVACTGALRGLTSLADRWTVYELTFLDVARPWHRFAGKFFALAADPNSSVSPFSPESGPAREAAVAIARTVVEGSTDRMDARLRAELPELLWLAHLGVTVHWVHDRSSGQRRSTALVRRVAPLLGRTLPLTRLKLLRGPLHDLLDVVADVRAPEPEPETRGARS